MEILQVTYNWYQMGEKGEQACLHTVGRPSYSFGGLCNGKIVKKILLGSSLGSHSVTVIFEDDSKVEQANINSIYEGIREGQGESQDN